MTIIKKFKNLFNKKNNFQSFVNYKNSTSKYSMTADCTMELSSSTNQKKQEINNFLKNLIKKYIDNPDKLIQYMRLRGAKIYRIDNANKILSFLNEEEGFITPQKGIKALALNAFTSICCDKKPKISFHSKEMLIFDTKILEIYTIARALHKYYGFINNIPGFDVKSQTIFKKVYGRKNNKNITIESMRLKDIFACREALARDLESINFTLQLSLEHERSKKALNKIITEKNAKV